MKQYQINNQIKSPSVRLIDADGKQVGVVSIADALTAARDVGMDLVALDENANPPVTKIINYDKLMYDQSKRDRAARKNQRDTKVRLFKFRSGIADHDINVNVRKIVKLLSNEKTVRLSVKLRGRESERREIADEVMNKVIAGIDSAEVEYQITAPLQFDNGELSITIMA